MPEKGSVPLGPQLEEEAELRAAKVMSQLSLKGQAAQGLAGGGGLGWVPSVGGESGEGLPREEQSYPGQEPCGIHLSRAGSKDLV